MKLAEKLTYLRKEKGLSQMKLAEMLKVSRQAISRWETGTAVPSSENLKYLGNLYDVSLDYLFNDDEDEPDRNKKLENISDKKVEVRRKKLDHIWIRWLVLLLCACALVAVTYVSTRIGHEEKFIPINNMFKENVETETGTGFDLDW